ncbi:hypothetical protein niasHT_026790 [Heterodera trifolii]|uniref:Uncharacterized protein n=1 Tax=Heterodera trifolii TaxID=157864 RepID=A0ABD2JUT5_9BILA
MPNYAIPSGQGNQQHLTAKAINSNRQMFNEALVGHNSSQTKQTNRDKIMTQIMVERNTMSAQGVHQISLNPEPAYALSAVSNSALIRPDQLIGTHSSKKLFESNLSAPAEDVQYFSNKEFKSDKTHLINSFNQQQGLLQHSPLDSDYHLNNPFGASSSSQMQQNPSNYFHYQNVPHDSANIDQSEGKTKNKEQMANENEKRKMKRPIVEHEAAKSEAKAKMEKRTKKSGTRNSGTTVRFCWRIAGTEFNQSKGNAMYGEMISEIDEQIGTAFGQSLLNELIGKESSEDFSKTRVLFFYSRFYRKLIGLLEAPYKKSDAYKYKDLPEKSQRVALIVWLIEAKKHLYREFASSLRLINSTCRNKINTLLIDSDRIEQWKEEMNLVFFAVEMTVAPLIGGNVLESRSELLKQIVQQQKHRVPDQGEGGKAGLEANCVADQCNNGTAASAGVCFRDAKTYEDKSWNMIKQFLIKSVYQLNELIKQWEQNANAKMMDKSRANANSYDIFTEKCNGNENERN